LIISITLGKERYEFAKELLAKGTTNVRNENILSNKFMNENNKSNYFISIIFKIFQIQKSLIRF
jgi:hypothetical protein